MVNLSLGFSFSTRTWRASTAKPSFFPNSFLDPVHYPGLNSSCSFFYPFFPHWGCGHKSPTRVPGTHKSSADEPSSLHSTSDPFHIDLLRLLLPCTPHTIPTIPAPAPSQTSSCPCPPPLTVTRHGLPAPVHAKDQMLKLPVSTTARHSVATVVIVDPTPQIALSAAVVTEVGGFPPIIVMNTRCPQYTIALPLSPLYYHQPFEAPYRSNVNANVQRVGSTRKLANGEGCS